LSNFYQGLPAKPFFQDLQCRRN